MHDWRADIRARVASARLHPLDEAELVEEVGQHLEEQFAELAPKIGAGPARDRLLAYSVLTETDTPTGSPMPRGHREGHGEPQP